MEQYITVEEEEQKAFASVIAKAFWSDENLVYLLCGSKILSYALSY